MSINRPDYVPPKPVAKDTKPTEAAVTPPRSALDAKIAAALAAGPQGEQPPLSTEPVEPDPVSTVPVEPPPVSTFDPTDPFSVDDEGNRIPDPDIGDD